MILLDITGAVSETIAGADQAEGVWLAHVPHTTAGITINEGADPAVARDILAVWERLVPGDLSFEHAEGNSPAHVLASIAGSSVLLAVEGREIKLGTWQSIFFCEFDGPRSRKVWLHKL